MTAEDAFQMICSAVRAIRPELADQVSRDGDLAGEGMLDSLDVMAFLFELEQLNGRRIETEMGFDEHDLARLIRAAEA